MADSNAIGLPLSSAHKHRHSRQIEYNALFYCRDQYLGLVRSMELLKAFLPTRPMIRLVIESGKRKALTMQFTRNRYFMAGMLLVMLGIQFRMVQSFVLNEPTTRTLSRITSQNPVASNAPSLASFLMQVYPSPRKYVEPPRWLGLAMVTIGAVVALHAMAMPKE